MSAMTTDKEKMRAAGARWTAARRKRVVGIREAALVAHVYPEILREIEAGNTEPSLAEAARLAKLYGCSLDYIAGGSEAELEGN